MHEVFSQNDQFQSKKNSIDSLLVVDGTISTDRVEISDHIILFY